MLKLKALHHVRFQVTDLDATERFATDFGLSLAARDGNTIYMRGAGSDAYSYVAETGPQNSFGGIAFVVESAAELVRAVDDYGATPIRELKSPGGGLMTTLTDPEGLQWHLIANIESVEPKSLRPSLQVNTGAAKERRGATQHKPAVGPPQLLKLGHVGIFVKDFGKASRWFQDVPGLLPSDVLYAGSRENCIGGFYRLNRGDEWVDHHTLAVFGMGRSDCHHISFEVQDSEAQFLAHRWLLQRGWEPIWGVGRHPLGSHVFDVWRDPAGYRFETYSDTDLCNASQPPGLHSIEGAQMDLWSNEHPEKYFK